jgi:Protein of unknown function (DUF2452)
MKRGRSCGGSAFLFVVERMADDDEIMMTHEQGTSSAFLPYPASRLAPKIVPQDLTSFKSRGVSRVERDLQQELVELREKYLTVMDSFNWNKLVYEARFSFEPVTGEVYHLYDIQNEHVLSMIPPEEWKQRWVASFRLGHDGRWMAQGVAQDFDLREWIDRKEGRR